MALTDTERARYARHLLLPELGEAGQLRLLDGEARFADGSDAGARAVAQSYLTRAGVAPARATGHTPGRTGAAGSVAAVLVEVSSQDECLRLAGRPELIEAARAVSGAFAAVEAIKALAGVGRPGRLWSDSKRLSSEEA